MPKYKVLLVVNGVKIWKTYDVNSTYDLKKIVDAEYNGKAQIYNQTTIS